MNTYQIAIVSAAGLKFIDVVAVDLQAAIADVEEAFFQPEIVSVSLAA